MTIQEVREELKKGGMKQCAVCKRLIDYREGKVQTVNDQPICDSCIYEAKEPEQPKPAYPGRSPEYRM